MSRYTEHIGKTDLSGEASDADTRWLFILSISAVFIFLAINLPIGLTAADDDLNGLAGYSGYFFTQQIILIIACCVGSTLWYRFTGPFVRTVTAAATIWLLVVSIFYAYFYPVSYGVLDNYILSGAKALEFNSMSLAADILALSIFLIMILWAVRRHPQFVVKGLALFIAASVAQASINIFNLMDKTDHQVSENTDSQPDEIYKYSKSGKNIVLFMVDGSMSGYLPDIFQKTPSLLRTYSGFTWYSNTVSTGNRTINGLPAIFGGFDYTVSEINKREGPLADKVNQAYSLYPDNFPRHGYSVLYSDPFWYGFQRRGDCKMFEEQNNGRCINQIDNVGRLQTEAINATQKDRLHNGLFKQYLAMSLFRAAPAFLKGIIYGKGDWMGWSYSWKRKEDKFLTNYYALKTLPDYSSTNSPGNTLTVIVNNITRATLLLGEDCRPDQDSSVSQSDLDKYQDRETVEVFQTMHCAIKEIGNYLDWFKANGIYENTMFVLVSDHGWKSHNPLLQSDPDQTTHSMFQNLLMIKPFGATGDPVESREFISTANVPGILCENIGGCFDSHTGRTVKAKKLEGPVLLHSTPWNPDGQDGDKFVIEQLYRVEKDITKAENWSKLQ